MSLEELDGFVPAPEEIHQDIGIDQHGSKTVKLVPNRTEINVIAIPPDAAPNSKAPKSILRSKAVEVLVNRFANDLALLAPGCRSNSRHTLGLARGEVNLSAYHTL